MQKLALLVYPEFSLQEVMNLSRLFRWHCDIMTEVVASTLRPVRSEEGILVQPQVDIRSFRPADYLCLVLPGCSDFTQVARDKPLLAFLSALRPGSLPIGAICSGPVLLARAGLLRGRKYTASIFAEVFDFCPFLERENFVPAPVVVAGDIVTAGGLNCTGFAVAMARLLGFSCPDRIMSGYMDDWTEADYLPHLPPEAVAMTQAMFAGLVEPPIMPPEA